MSVVQKIEVVSYNVLTDALASPEDYPSYPILHLDPDARFRLICEKISATIKEGRHPVFCLQEVPYNRTEMLFKLFSALNYGFDHDMTHSKEDRQWGLAMAYPKSIYRKESLTHARLGGLIEKPNAELERHMENETKTTGRLSDYDQTISTDHSSMVLRLQIRATNQHITIVNTHLACKFFIPNVMALQIHALFRSFESHYPVILAGDFNTEKGSPISSNPRDPVFSLLTGGSLPVDVTTRNPYAPQFFDFPRKMLEAYADEEKGQHSSVTSYCRTRFNMDRCPAGWAGHISHILYDNDGGLELIETRKLPTSLDEISLLPNETEGSDHLMIGATFAFTPLK